MEDPFRGEPSAGAAAEAVGSQSPGPEMRENVPGPCGPDSRDRRARSGAALPAAALPAALTLKTHDYQNALQAELAPTTALESILVDEMGRHAAAMNFAADAEARVLRFAASSSGDSPLKSPDDAPHDQDALFAAAVTNHATERVERFGQQHRRGFYRAWGQLQLLRGLNHATDDAPLATIFANEEACESYLIGRLQASPPQCPRCEKRKHHFLASRRRFECAACGVQFGPRAGTVMERSPLRLTAWFAAIQAVCANVRITVRDLSEQTCVKRLPTVRTMRQKILSAIKSGQVERLLAGLHALEHGPAAPAPGAPFAPKPNSGQRIAGTSEIATRKQNREDS